MLKEARAMVADAMEEVGAVAMHLREAKDFAETNATESAVASVEDALDAIDTTIQELTKIRDKAGRWAVWAEGKAAS